MFEVVNIRIKIYREAINNHLSERDYIVDRGSNLNGEYIKWNSGILEQWFSGKRSAGITNAYGSLYQGTHDWFYPIEFIDTPDTVICSKAQYDTGASWGTIYSFTKQYATIRAYDIVSRPVDKKLNVILYAKGKWK